VPEVGKLSNSVLLGKRAGPVPTKGYAAPVWYAPSCIGVRSHLALERAERLPARLILRAYKSVAILVLQKETKLRRVSERLHEHVLNHITKLYSFTLNQPLQRYVWSFKRKGLAFLGPLSAVYEKYEGQVGLEIGPRISEQPS